MDFFLNLDQHLLELLHQYGAWFYFILFLIAFAEIGILVFAFLPGDTLLLMAGTLAANRDVDFLLVVLALWSATLLGSQLGYWTGYWVSERVFRWEDSHFFRRATFDKAHAFYEKHGGKMVILSRFIPFVRTFSPFVAGAAEMRYRYFTLTDVVGGTMWVLTFTLMGFWFGHLPLVRDNLSLVVSGLLLASVFSVVVAAVARGWQKRKAKRASP